MAEVIECERREDHVEPSGLDGLSAEVPEIRIERFAPVTVRNTAPSAIMPRKSVRQKEMHAERGIEAGQICGACKIATMPRRRGLQTRRE